MWGLVFFVQNSHCFGAFRCLHFYETCMFMLRKYKTDSSENLAAIYQSTGHNIPENCYFGRDHRSSGLGIELTATSS